MIHKGGKQLHGGAIWVESAPGQGRTFGFRLPLRASTPASDEGGR